MLIELNDASDEINTVAWSMGYLATGSDDRRVRMYDVGKDRAGLAFQSLAPISQNMAPSSSS